MWLPVPVQELSNYFFLIFAIFPSGLSTKMALHFKLFVGKPPKKLFARLVKFGILGHNIQAFLFLYIFNGVLRVVYSEISAFPPTSLHSPVPLLCTQK